MLEDPTSMKEAMHLPYCLPPQVQCPEKKPQEVKRMEKEAKLKEKRVNGTEREVK